MSSHKRIEIDTKENPASLPQAIYKALITLNMWSSEGFIVIVAKSTSHRKSEEKLLMLLGGSCHCSLNWKVNGL